MFSLLKLHLKFQFYFTKWALSQNINLGGPLESNGEIDDKDDAGDGVYNPPLTPMSQSVLRSPGLHDGILIRLMPVPFEGPNWTNYH